tara:strand:- start:30080 stop:30757 length:678 start_codon:yes stop_codon:yes gene_type:complete
MKNYILLFLLIVSNQIFSQKTISHNLGDFYKIKVYRGIHVEIIKSKEQKIEIQGDKADKVKIKNKDGVLKISLKLSNLFSEGQANVKLYFNKDIFVIDGNEGSLITGKNINQTHIEIKAQEKAFINLVIQTKFLKVKAISGGIIKLTGKSKNQEIDLDLYGVYHGYGLSIVDNTTISVGTGAKAELKAGETLNAKVSFGGSIFYKGSPAIINDKKVAGGIIKQMN